MKGISFLCDAEEQDSSVGKNRNSSGRSTESAQEIPIITEKGESAGGTASMVSPAFPPPLVKILYPLQIRISAGFDASSGHFTVDANTYRPEPVSKAA